jgi:hypothetical protein
MQEMVCWSRVLVHFGYTKVPHHWFTSFHYSTELIQVQLIQVQVELVEPKVDPIDDHILPRKNLV